MKHKKFLVVILGPTAAGKTAVAIEVAKEFSTEIVSADSRQFFKEITIGTAKPNQTKLEAVKHHFINSHSVKEDYNVGKFEQEALALLEKLFLKKSVVVMAGGSGLYIDAVCKGFDKLPEADEEIRSRLSELFKTKGITALREMLKKLDAEHYKKVDLKNPHRIMRALEVCLITGKPYSALRKGEKAKRNFSVIKIGLDIERGKLYERINQRVDEMMQAGLLQEVKQLQQFKTKNALQTVSYKELFEHLEGKTTLHEAVEKVKQNTRNFAKRQLTWFRRDKKVQWFAPDDVEKIIQYIKLSLRAS